MELTNNTALLIGLAPVAIVGVVYVVHVFREGRRLANAKKSPGHDDKPKR